MLTSSGVDESAARGALQEVLIQQQDGRVLPGTTQTEAGKHRDTSSVWITVFMGNGNENRYDGFSHL
jgi:hypothetical protein